MGARAWDRRVARCCTVLSAQHYGSRARLVSVVGDDYPAGVLEKLQQRGVDLTVYIAWVVVACAPGSSTRSTFGA